MEQIKDAFRLDASAIGKAEITAQGFLRVPVTAGRVGVFPYVYEDGRIVYEYKPAEELFAQMSMDTLKSAPLTDEHPMDSTPPLVTIENAPTVMRGFLSDTVARDGLYLNTFATITDRGLIEEIRSGKKREVSPGYLCDVDLVSGIWVDPRTGIPYHYDRIQRNIRHNHLAAVTDGREGPEVKIRLDSKSAKLYSENTQEETREDVMGQGVNEGNDQQGRPEKMKFDGEEIAVHPKVAAHINALTKNVEDLTRMHSELKDRFDAMEKEKGAAVEKTNAAEEKATASEAKCNSLQGELDALKTRINAADDPKKFSDAVASRVALETDALTLLGEERFNALSIRTASDVEIKKAVIHHHTPKAELDEKPIEYIDGMFSAVKGAPRTNAGTELGQMILAPSADVLAAEEKSRARYSEAWKTPVGMTREKAFALSGQMGPKV